MTRLEAVKDLFCEVENHDIVICSTGYISREIFHYKDRPLNFYMQGSMGAALAIGIGVALYKDTDVYVVHGDGAALMSLGTFATLEQLPLLNIHNVIFNNNTHESTGGQKTAHNDFTQSCFH